MSGEGVCTVVSIAWLVSAVGLWLRPASFPAWVFDVMNIIFWVGLIPVIIFAIILVVYVIWYMIWK